VRVAAIEVDFRIPGSDSLKAKRMVVRSLKDRIRARFPVAVAEVGHLDLHARAQLGVAAVGADGAVLARALDDVLRLIESDARVLVVDVIRSSL
jgi:uncharacterized protein YlxP (DUF503 family)